MTSSDKCTLNCTIQLMSTDAMTEIKHKLQGLIGHDSVTEVNIVTSDVLKEACCRMQG